MDKLIDAIVIRFTDPFQLLAVLVIAGLFYLLLQKDKLITGQNVTIEKNTQAIANGNVAIVELTTLIELLVYGPERRKR